MTRSIRGRLLLSTVAGTLTIVLIGGVIVYRATCNRFWRVFDDALVARARLLASLVEREGDRFEFEIDYRILPEFTRADRPEYFEIWRQDGRPIARSPSLPAQGLAPPATGSELLFTSLMLPDGRSGRAAIIETVARDDSDRPSAGRGGIRVMFAKETAQLEGELHGLRRILIGIGLVVTALTAGVLVGVVWRGLAPLNRLAAKIAALRTENLSDRIDLPDAPAELAPVVEVSNQLLQRLETAVDRERSFTADVAHELRTPLAGVRSVLEVALSRDRPAQDYQAAMRECLRIAASMQTMTGNLLSLARLDRGQLTVRREPVPLRTLLQECWEPLEGSAKARSLRVSWNGDPAVVMETDRELLRQILTNLLDNAVVYADSGGEIRVDTGLEAGAAFVRIANTGSQVPQDQVERVFERFWRGDASRHGVGRHAGLGLSLARRLVTLLGGTLIATSQLGQWFTVTLTLPASNSPPDRPAGTHSLANAAEE